MLKRNARPLCRGYVWRGGREFVFIIHCKQTQQLMYTVMTSLLWGCEIMQMLSFMYGKPTQASGDVYGGEGRNFFGIFVIVIHHKHDPAAHVYYDGLSSMGGVRQCRYSILCIGHLYKVIWSEVNVGYFHCRLPSFLTILASFNNMSLSLINQEACYDSLNKYMEREETSAFLVSL